MILALLLAASAGAQEGLLPQGTHASLTLDPSIESSKSVLDQHDYLLWTSGLRGDATWRRDDFSAVAVWDLDFREGDYFTTLDSQVAGRQAPRSALQFGNAITTDPHYRLDDRPYRLYGDWTHEAFELRAGRQRTQWSEGIAFSAVDFMHLYQPMDISSDLEPNDSIYGRAGPFSAEYAPARLWNDAKGIARIGKEENGNSIYGYFGKDSEEDEARTQSTTHPRLVAAASLRIAIPNGRVTAEQATYNSHLTEDFDRSLLSFAWGRRGHEWLAAEYYYNGQGTGTSGYDRAKIVRGEWGVLGRHYVNLHLGDPESVRLLWNAGDGSYMFEVAERRGLGALTLSGGVQFFGGPPTSEFAGYSDRLWASLACRFDLL